MKNKILLLKLLIILVMIVLSIYIVNVLINLDIIPNKYITIISCIMCLFNIVGALCLLLKNKTIKAFTIFNYLIIILLTVFITIYGNETMDFFKNAFNNFDKEVTVYNVITLKDNKIKNINELKDKTIAYLNYDDNNYEVIDRINKKVSVKYKEKEDLFDLYNGLITYKYEAIILNEAYLDILEDDHESLNNIIDIIYSFSIEKIIEKQSNKFELKPINIFISGSDSRSNKLYNKSRSDVNMILTFNPSTKTILTTSIPRDYFVQVHGQTGLKDKLTHAGIYGIDISSATVEDLFDIKIDYNLKIGFNAVVEIVDLIGGIDIDSDKEFNSYHFKGWTVKKGINHMNGKQALAYSRERYAYSTGDRHRVANQQQVLEAVLKGILDDNKLLSKYNDYLKLLSSLYMTTIPDKLIKTVVKDELDNRSNWKFISQTVSGSDLLTYTHTAQHSKRYVMVPYPQDVKRASNKIKEVLNGN